MFTPLYIQSAHAMKGNPFLVEEYVEDAVKKGYKTVVLNEYETLTNALSFYTTCLHYNVKPIIAMHFTYKEQRISAVANEYSGFEELLQLTSQIASHQPYELHHYHHLHFWFDALNDITVPLIQTLRHDRCLFVVTPTNKEQLLLAQTHHMHCIASVEVRYLNEDSAEIYDALQQLLAIKRVSTNSEQLGQSIAQQTYALEQAKTYHQTLGQLFSQTLVKQTQTYLNTLNTEIVTVSQTLPQFAEHPNELLNQLALEGLKQRQCDTDVYYERLQKELAIIEQMGFANYFLMIWDIVQFAKREHITLSAGRGSAAASLVLYALGVTQIDPIQYQLIFERFLNPQRQTMPDVDLDLPDNRRYDVIAYVNEKYHHEHVAQIGTFQTFGPRGSLKDVAKLMQLQSWEIEQLSQQMGNVTTLAHDHPALISFSQKSPTHAKVIRIAKAIERLPKNLSKHAAGVVISQRPICRVVSCYQEKNYIATQDASLYITQYTMHAIEKVGLLKMDFLGVKHLTLLAMAQQYIQKTHKNFNIWTIDFNDAKTFELFAKGDTDGVFQFDSVGIRQVLRQIKPDSIAELATVCALYRPGPMDQSHHYYQRKFNQEAVVYINDTLKTILQETYGIIIYQEQIMQIAVKMANFTLGQADLLRRGISKKNATEIQNLKMQFVTGAIANGYQKEEAEEVFQYIEKFADYGFAKSHALAYAVFAYQMAYIKAHYPTIYYFCCIAKSNARSTAYTNYITLAMQQGVQFQLPHINNSLNHTTLLSNNSIQLGFSAISGIRKDVALAIVKQRQENGAFQSFDQFLSRMTLGQDVIEKLIKSGCFDTFEYTRATLLHSVQDLQERQKFQNIAYLTKKLEMIEEFSNEVIAEMETTLLGFSFTVNHFVTYLPYYDNGVFHKTTAIQENDSVVLLAQFKTIRKITTKNSERMAFVQIEDIFGKINGVIFPKIYPNVMAELVENKVCVIRGKIDNRNGQLQCVVQSIASIDTYLQWYEETKKVVFIKFPSRQHVKKIEQILQTSVGGMSVMAYYSDEKAYKSLSAKYRVHLTTEAISQIEQVLGEGSVVIKQVKNQ